MFQGQFESHEAEQLLLGGLLLRNKGMLEIDLTEGDFYQPAHGEIFGIMRKVFAAKQKIDLSDFGSSVGMVPMEGGAETIKNYVRLLAEACASPVNVRDWAKTIRELSRKREILAVIEAAKLEIGEKTSSEIIASIQSELTAKLDAKRQKTAEEIRQEIVTDMDRPPVFYPTGLKSLDAGLAGGFYEGFTYGLCGKEKAGKTTFAHSISFGLPCKHLYVALEMGAKQIEQRNLARSVGVNSLEFLTPSPELKNKIETARQRSNTVYLDAPGGTVEEILHEVGISRLKHGIKGFIVDYWQLVQGGDKRETEERHLRTVAQSFADYARRNGLWCLLLAQMNKDGDLFGGGGLRKACDQLYFIETPEHTPDMRWMRMGASRYTPMADIGGESDPKFSLNKKRGPYFEEAYQGQF